MCVHACDVPVLHVCVSVYVSVPVYACMGVLGWGR